MPDFSQPVSAISVEVPPEHEGQRLDSYLPRRFNWRSRAYFLELLTSGTVTVNGKHVKKAYRVRSGDVISLELPEQYQQPFDYASIPLTVLHEDDQLVVINKAGDLAVQPTGRYIHENLLYRLRYHYRDERGDPACDPCIVHRLDRETSGVIVFAKSRQVARRLSMQFADRLTQKRYLAVVHGTPPSSGTINAPLLSTSDRHVVVDPAGKSALTRYAVQAQHGPYALVALELLTGRQHQLRVHLASIGHPIVADPFYGHAIDRETPGLPRRQMLHAHQLVLPATAERAALTVEAPLAPDMRALLERHPATEPPHPTPTTVEPAR